jgi:hypothetical protein
LFSLDDIIDFVFKYPLLLLGLLGTLAQFYSQYAQASKKAQLENQRKLEEAQRQEKANGFEGYLERTNPTKLDDERDDFSQTGQHNGPRPARQQTAQQDTRGFDELARDLQQARNQTTEANDPQAQLRRLLAEKMGRAPTASTNPNTSRPPIQPPLIGRPVARPTKTSARAFDPDRTAASTFMPSSVTGPTSLEQNRVIEASFERTLNKSNLEPKLADASPTTRVTSGTMFSSQDAVRAVIWSEVLGAPKSRRR